MKRILWILGLALFLTACEKEPQEEIPTDIVKDHEGNEYQTKVYGTQTWMVENMRCITTKSGVNILKCPANGQFSYEEPMAYYVYDKEEYSTEGRGYLYNYAAAQEICPEGWHLPLVEEYEILMDYIQQNYTNNYNDDVITVAKAMASQNSWHSCDTIGTPGYHAATNNTSGFSLRPVGYYGTPQGTAENPDFSNYYWSSLLWTSTSVMSEMNKIFGLWSYDISPKIQNATIFQAMSVRCVKNEEEPTPDVTTDPNTHVTKNR